MMTDRPLGEVLATNAQDFAPEHPRSRPWHQPTLRGYDLATTGNVAVVNLAVADRACLSNLDRASTDQDWLEPVDWMAGPGWGMPPPA
jgi:hypothetical protein